MINEKAKQVEKTGLNLLHIIVDYQLNKYLPENSE